MNWRGSIRQSFPNLVLGNDWLTDRGQIVGSAANSAALASARHYETKPTGLESCALETGLRSDHRRSAGWRHGVRGELADVELELELVAEKSREGMDKMMVTISSMTVARRSSPAMPAGRLSVVDCPVQLSRRVSACQQRAVHGVFIAGELPAVAAPERLSMPPRNSISFATLAISGPDAGRSVKPYWGPGNPFFADELDEFFGPMA